MKQRTLGRSGLQLGVLGLGCWQFGGGAYWGAQDQRDVEQVVDTALGLGLNYFDTAEGYNDGESEVSLGEALKGRRHEAVIGSKLSTSHAYPDIMKAHCEASLRRLQTDYIDVYMLHWPIHPLAIKHFKDDPALLAHPPQVQEAFEGLRRLQREGKVRHIGISNHGVRQMEEVAATGVPVTANELAYNLFSRAIEREIAPYCAAHEIGVIGYIPLMQGLLSGRIRSFDELPPIRARTRHFHHSRGDGSRHGEEGAEAEMAAALQGIAGVAEELGVTMNVLALAFAIANETVTTTIVGARNREQLEQNARAAAFELSPETLGRLKELTGPVLAKLGDNPDYYENRASSRIE